MASATTRPAAARPIVVSSLRNDLSAPLRALRPARIAARRDWIGARRLRPGPLGLAELGRPTRRDPALQRVAGGPKMPAASSSFDGISNTGQSPAIGGSTPVPPDTNGDVGPGHYVQMVNLTFAVYSKTSTLLFGPVATNTLWSGFGGPCETANEGDPIVLYDELADRWVISQFAFAVNASDQPVGPFLECIAVSQSSDPTGQWYRYAFQISTTKLNDYPKLAVWPDGYYMSANQFVGTTFAGAAAVVFERNKMLVGQPAQMVYIDLQGIDPNLGGMLPSDLDGLRAPPLGAPNYFVQVDDSPPYPQDQLELWRFHVDWRTTFASSFTRAAVLPTTSFDSNLCNYLQNCIPQPAPGVALDAISDRLMNRLAYRNLGTHEALVLNHTVDINAADQAGIRWYEIRSPGAAPAIFQQGTYAGDSADSVNRWMGSVAMDDDGNIALGYSAASASLSPSIRYVGRLASDPAGTLPQVESVLAAGAGSQTDPSGRWGDYSMMAVDPADDCTFWYTQEYYAATSARGWQTRIGAFRFPSCSGPAPDTTPPTDPVLAGVGNAPGVASTDTTIDVSFTGPGDDFSGVDGYSFLFDTSPTTVPDAVKDAEETDVSTTSPTLVDGAYYFHLRTLDNAGNWTSTAHLGPFVVDTTVPTGAEVGGVGLASVFQRKKVFPVAWSAVDAGSGISTYDVSHRKAKWSGGFGVSAGFQSATSATSASFTGSPGSTYCFTAIAKDAAGNSSAASPERCTAVPLDDRELTAKGRWKRRRGGGFYLGTYSISSTHGDQLVRKSVQARGLAVLVSRCRGCGTIRVSFNGRKLKTINLGSRRTRRSELLSVASFLTVRTGTVRIEVVSSGKPVQIEGLGVSRT